MHKYFLFSFSFEQWIYAAQRTTPVSFQFSIQGHVSSDTEAVNLCCMPHWTNDPWPRRIQEETPVRSLCSRLQNPPKSWTKTRTVSLHTHTISSELTAPRCQRPAIKPLKVTVAQQGCHFQFRDHDLIYI